MFSYAATSLGRDGLAEDNPSHWPPNTSRLRPDACLPVCCTLPAGCTLLGFACLSKAPCLANPCCITSPMHAVGSFSRLCTPCCSLHPLVEQYTAGLDRPATAFLSDDGSYGHVARGDYEALLRDRGDWPEAAGLRRRADGSGMHPRHPYLGQAGRPYAVAVPNKSVAARLGGRLPDAGAVFDDLFARGTFAPCPCGANALIVFTALLATHEFFRTDEGRGEDGDGVERPWVNANSSFLDLQSLYGSNAARTRALRDGARLRDGALGDENRLAALPTVAAILGLFRAEHNAIVDALRRNDPAAFADDDACFEQARAIVLAIFILVVLYDYVGGINGSPRWSLERFLLNARPYAEDPVPMHGSVEFKLLYQFHASIPERWAPRDATDGAEALLRDAIATPAGAFGARNTPRFLRAAEVKAIEWGRRVGACSYNDLREKIGLPRRTAWAQLSSDPDVRAALERHYPGGVDDLELYVGVTVEEYDAQLVSHRGWSIPQTLYYAIRNDAVSSGLGDRFHTRGLDAAHLTEWGYDRALTSGRLAVLVNRHTKLNLPPHADIFRAPAGAPGAGGGARVAPAAA